MLLEAGGVFAVDAEATATINCVNSQSNTTTAASGAWGGVLSLRFSMPKKILNRKLMTNSERFELHSADLHISQPFQCFQQSLSNIYSVLRNESLKSFYTDLNIFALV